MLSVESDSGPVGDTPWNKSDEFDAAASGR